jgi:lipopolysaccharide export LptBFGC system permease protein LptF
MVAQPQANIEFEGLPSQRELVSQRAFADAVGVSQTSVRKAIHNGRIAVEPDGRIDLEAQKVNWVKNQDIAKIRSNSTVAESEPNDENSVVNALADARALKEQYNAKLKKLDYERQSGKLIERTVVENTIFRFIRNTRDELLNLPARVAAEQAASLTQYLESILTDNLPARESFKVLPMIDPKAIESIVHNAWTRESRKLLEDLAGGESGIIK